MTFQTLCLLEHNPFPAARWLTPAVVEVELAISEYMEDAVAEALDSLEDPTDI